MPRRARLRLAGLPLHLIQRGNNRTACFFADEDYSLYLHQMEKWNKWGRSNISGVGDIPVAVIQ